jgi:hypothetical protein
MARTEEGLLDGELVALDEHGRPDFATLWFRSRGSSDRPVCFMAFDVLQIGDEAVIDRPYQRGESVSRIWTSNVPHGVRPTRTSGADKHCSRRRRDGSRGHRRQEGRLTLSARPSLHGVDQDEAFQDAHLPPARLDPSA